MNDSAVQTIIKTVLDTAIVAGPFSATVAQEYNPTQQGVPRDPVVLFAKISARNWGWQSRKSVYNSGNDNFDVTEQQWVRPTYQLNVVATQNPVDPASLSAYDVVSFCAMSLASAASRATFKAAGIGIDRILDIRTPGSKDDADRFAKNVNFDFVLSYRNTLETTIPGATVDVQVGQV